ncbi:hypothetical protein PVAP13_1NG331800 [Panicum virgatum]|uniref:UDP-N-acetylglucosamine transferase subunit ALG14 n=1 Tax=Panicum virgatum TaxID=38727 RepID=A0A8T0WZS5_PANVG|nr:hypothetical protein PVAP13_1NG331800 [Panicum virgatum]
MPWRPRAASFRYSSRCSPAASHTCFGAAASRRPSLPPPGCGVSSSSDLSEEKTIKNAHFMQIYRSREVGQTYITSIATTLLATMHAMWLVISIRPQVIFCNGPGTCFPLCVCAFALKVLGLGWSSIFYIESIARVKKLSLSGLLLYKLRIADQFFVQWLQLQQSYPRAYYAGRLM